MVNINIIGSLCVSNNLANALIDHPVIGTRKRLQLFWHLHILSSGICRRFMSWTLTSSEPVSFWFVSMNNNVGIKSSSLQTIFLHLRSMQWNSGNRWFMVQPGSLKKFYWKHTSFFFTFHSISNLIILSAQYVAISNEPKFSRHLKPAKTWTLSSCQRYYIVSFILEICPFHVC